MAPRAGIERFQERYVFGNELDLTIGRSGGAGGSMTKVVIGLGVKPVCERPAFVSYLFERAEVMEALTRWDGVTNQWLGDGVDVVSGRRKHLGPQWRAAVAAIKDGHAE